MQKLIVLLMDKQYPFTEDNLLPTQSHTTLVRQTIHTTHINHSTILAKANFLKNLKNKYLVKVDSLLQQQQSIHIMYEYVQKKLINILKQSSILLINKIYAQLNQFGRYLSNIGVRILFCIDRMGFNDKECLKYFMGVEYEWEEDPDEEFLEQFYEKQIQQILGDYIRNESNQLGPASPTISSPSFQRQKQRKISYSTLPSRYNRYNKIDQKLKQLKYTPKIINNNQQKSIQKHISQPKQIHKFTKSSQNIAKYNNHAIKKQITYTKTIEDRKYSGDIKYQVTSLSKLIQKDNDIQSQICKRKKKVMHLRQQQQPNHSETTNKTKSRAQQMKQKQYKQISNQNKDYLKDFISVLQQQQQQIITSLPITKAIQFNFNLVQNKGQDTALKQSKNMQSSYNLDEKTKYRSTAQLQHRASQAIKHSMKVINNFRRIIK